jgi:hypothetical protein
MSLSAANWLLTVAHAERSATPQRKDALEQQGSCLTYFRRARASGRPKSEVGVFNAAEVADRDFGKTHQELKGDARERVFQTAGLRRNCD